MGLHGVRKESFCAAGNGISTANYALTFSFSSVWDSGAAAAACW